MVHRSSVVEQETVNFLVVGSNPTDAVLQLNYLVDKQELRRPFRHWHIRNGVESVSDMIENNVF